MAVSKQRAPSFKGFTSSSEIHTRTKRANRSSNIGPELALRKALHRICLRFRLKTEHLLGRLDLTFPSARTAISCDGDFWHGRDWDNLRSSLRRRANPDYWLAKIGYNHQHNIEVTRKLARAEWRVMWLWESEILQDPEGAAKRVGRLLYANTDPNTLEVKSK